jgi:hypothetical protein
MGNSVTRLRTAFEVSPVPSPGQFKRLRFSKSSHLKRMFEGEYCLVGDYSLSPNYRWALSLAFARWGKEGPSSHGIQMENSLRNRR